MKPLPDDVSSVPASAPNVNSGMPGQFSGGLVRQAVSRWGAQILSWGSTIVVARRLSPEDYGLVGMGVLYLGIVAMIAEFGLGSTIVAQRNLSEDEMDQLHGLSLGAGTFCFLFSLGIAPVLASFYGEPRVRLVLSVLSVAFVFSGYSAVPLARARRALDYRAVSSAELIGAVTTTLVVLTLALAGAKFWALVIGNISGTGAIALRMYLKTKSRPRVPNFRKLRGTLGYSRHVMSSQIAYYAYANTDSLAIGKLLGASQLGFYRFAFFVTSIPGEKLVNVVGSVSLAYFGKLCDDLHAMRRFFLLLTEAIAVVVFPILVGLILVASDAIPLLFGTKWSVTVTPIQIMAAGAIVQVMAALLSQILTATMQARAASRYSFATLLLLPPLYWLAATSSWGIVAVSMMWALAQPLSNLASLRRVLRTLDLRFRDYLRTLVPACVGCSVMTVVLISSQVHFVSAESTMLRLVSKICIGALAYAFIQLTLFRRHNLRLIHEIRAA